MGENGHTYLVLEDLDGVLGPVEQPFAEDVLPSRGFVRRRDEDQLLAVNGLVATPIPNPNPNPNPYINLT